MSRRVVISTSRVNRKGFRLLSSGGDVEQYRKNPVLLFMHNRPWRGTQDEVLALGTVKDVRLEGDEWVGELDFDMDDPFAAKVAKKWDKGIYKMVSAGVTPVEFSDAPEHVLPGQRYATLTRWRLDEISVVDIGANDDALSIKNAQTGKYITLGDDTDLSFLPTITHQTDKPKMEKIAIKLGLATGASEDDICAAIDKLTGRVTDLQTRESEIRLKAITQAVDTAIREKRISDKQKEHFVKLGQDTNLETLATTLSAIEPAVKPTELIDGKGGQGRATSQGDKKWGDLTEKEIETLKADDPASYALKFEEHYGFAPVLNR